MVSNPFSILIKTLKSESGVITYRVSIGEGELFLTDDLDKIIEKCYNYMLYNNIEIPVYLQRLDGSFVRIPKGRMGL